MGRPRAPLTALAHLLSLLRNACDGQDLPCPHGKFWTGSGCPRRSTHSYISSVTGCCNLNQKCPEDASRYPGTTKVEGGHKTCECGTIPDPPQPDECKPSCSDRRRNGDEQGVDCGGSCGECPCSVPGKPPCQCTPKEPFGRCTRYGPNSVEQYNCQDGCQDPRELNYTLWCIERRHLYPAVNTSICREYPSSYPSSAGAAGGGSPPPPPTIDTAGSSGDGYYFWNDPRPTSKIPWDDACWLSCHKLDYLKMCLAFLVFLGVLKCMHKFKLGCFKPKKEAESDTGLCEFHLVASVRPSELRLYTRTSSITTLMQPNPLTDL